MFCHNCGSEISDDANFCVNCGTKLIRLDEEKAQPSKSSSRGLSNKKTDEQKETSSGRGLFNKKTKEQKEAIKEIKSYTKGNYKRFRQIIPRYGILTMEVSHTKVFNRIIKTIKKEIENENLTADQIEGRVFQLLTEEYGEPMSQEDADELFNQQNLQTKLENERKLEQKFGVPFQNRVWFKCTVDEMRHSTFSNTNDRDIVDGYVFVEDTFLEIVKESVFLKSKMGTRKIFYDNIASIDHDAKGRLNLSSSLEIYLKSSDRVQLKHVNKGMVDLVTGKYNEYMESKINGNAENVTNASTSNVDELMKYADLYERGLLTQEEFEQKKKELL